MGQIRPSESNNKGTDLVGVNTNQFVHFVGAGSQLVLHCNLPSLHDVVDSGAAGSSLSEVATCLEQLGQEKVKKRQDRNGERRRRS